MGEWEDNRFIGITNNYLPVGSRGSIVIQVQLSYIHMEVGCDTVSFELI